MKTAKDMKVGDIAYFPNIKGNSVTEVTCTYSKKYNTGNISLFFSYENKVLNKKSLCKNSDIDCYGIYFEYKNAYIERELYLLNKFRQNIIEIQKTFDLQIKKILSIYEAENR